LGWRRPLWTVDLDVRYSPMRQIIFDEHFQMMDYRKNIIKSRINNGGKVSEERLYDARLGAESICSKKRLYLMI
jgi:hypothetical protein